MKNKHWNKIFALLDGAPPTSLKAFDLQYLLNENID